MRMMLMRQWTAQAYRDWGCPHNLALRRAARSAASLLHMRTKQGLNQGCQLHAQGPARSLKPQSQPLRLRNKQVEVLRAMQEHGEYGRI